jgi:lantibiotic biosynthesis protein
MNYLYDIDQTFVVRTPLLPFNFFMQLLNDEKGFKENLNTLILRCEISEALFLASPELYEQLYKWLNGSEVDEDKKDRFFQSLYKYLSRMSSRSTPFGLFAGCGIGKVGVDTEVRLCHYMEHKRHTRLDMSYLCNLANALSKNKIIKNEIRYFPNTSIYQSGNKFRYIEYRYNMDFRSHHLIEIKSSDILTMVLNVARNGVRVEELINLVMAKNVPFDQANEYIEKLLENQILISELDPTVTGEEFLDRILKILSPIKNIENIKDVLNLTVNKINKIDLKIGNTPNMYYEIAKDHDVFGIDYNIKFLFQTDLILNLKKSSVSRLTLDSINEGLVLFNKLTSKSKDSKISKFKEAFTKRYETRECSLLKVLDTETGIGYLQSHRNSEGDFSPLVADIGMPYQENYQSKLELDKIQEFLLEKFLMANGSYEVVFTDDDLRPFTANWDDLPVTFYSMVKLIESPSEKYPGGRIFMENAGGNSASQILGRFCHSNNAIYEHVKEIADFERKFFNNAILAEIVHLPETRVGNVILRPIIQDYEIPFLASAGVDPEHTIKLDDLYISVQNNEIVLHSKKYNKRVIPRMSNAHNYSYRALPIYQFLCDLQSQNLRSYIGFNWGSHLDFYPFRPRAIYKNIVLSPASWTVQKESISSFIKIKDDNQLLMKVNDWRDKNRIPALVLLESNDNTLLISFNSLLSVKTLLNTIKNMDTFILKEFLFNPEKAVVKSDEDIFTNEFIFTFSKHPKNEKSGI